MTKKPPFIIGETASAESGGDKALWKKWGLLDALPRYFPRIAWVQWFDILKEADWRINSSRLRWMPTGTWLRPTSTRVTYPIRKNREGGYFPSRLEPRRRAERALSAVVQEA